MQDQILSNENNIEQNHILQEIEQKDFLETTMGKVVNIGLDLGIRSLLPDLIEDGAIEIKDALLESCLEEGIQKGMQTIFDLGKSAVGIVTGNFENIEQIQMAVKKGGVIDSLSNILDFALNKTESAGILDKDITSVLKSGKNIILDSMTNQIEKEFEYQNNCIEKLNTSIQNWNQYFKKQDIKGMEKEYKKIKQDLQNVIPLENTIKEARKIENIHILVQQKGGDYHLDNIELVLAEKLI